MLIYSTLSVILLFAGFGGGILGLLHRVLAALSGILLSMALCSLLLETQWVKRVILPYSDKTYSIYLLSWFGQYAVKFVVINMLNLHWAVCVVCMFVGGLIVPLAVDWLEDKLKLSRSNPIRLITGY